MASSISAATGFGGGPTAYVSTTPSYEAGCAAAAFNTQPWSPRSFFDGPRINAPELVEFGVGKTYDFFA